MKPCSVYLNAQVIQVRQGVSSSVLHATSTGAKRKYELSHIQDEPADSCSIHMKHSFNRFRGLVFAPINTYIFDVTLNDKMVCFTYDHAIANRRTEFSLDTIQHMTWSKMATLVKETFRLGMHDVKIRGDGRILSARCKVGNYVFIK